MFKNSNNWIIILIIIVIVVIIIFWVNGRDNSKKSVVMEPKNVKKEVIPEKKIILYNFYSPSCPACKGFMETWEKIEKRFADSKIIKTKAIDCQDPVNSHIVFYYNIKYYPTIILTTPKGSYEFTEDRSMNNIIEFISKNAVK